MWEWIETLLKITNSLITKIIVPILLFLSTGVFGTVLLALLAIAISILSGHYFTKILVIFNMPSGQFDAFIILTNTSLFKAYLYLTGIFVCSFWFKEFYMEREAKIDRDKLYRTIRTMPPVGIMNKFKQLYMGATTFIARNTLGDKNEKRSKDESIHSIDDAIRLCSDALSSLAFAFQRDDDARFAANVMTYHSVSMVDDSDRETVLELLDGMIINRSFDGLKGYLLLDKSLTSSTTDADNSFAMDELADNMALPVPESAKSRHNENLFRLLPGAPYALEYGDYIIDDTHTIREAIRTKHDIATSIGDNIHRYFTGTDAGKAVRSFISMKVTRFNHDEDDIKPLGVINVHCDKVGLFANDDVARSFIALSKPFIDLIAKLLIRRSELA